jgi:group I intron endonuclease
MKTKFSSSSSISIKAEIQISVNGEIKLLEFSGAKGKIKSGVYCLRNKSNNKFYIGMAKNLEHRYQHHKSDVLLGKHINKEILKDFNPSLSFEEQFSFEVIIYCRPSELTFFENLLINSLQPDYNIHKKGENKNDLLSSQ